MLDGKVRVAVIDHWADKTLERTASIQLFDTAGFKIFSGYSKTNFVETCGPLAEYDVIFVHFPRCGARGEVIPQWLKEFVKKNEKEIYFISHDRSINERKKYPDLYGKEFLILGFSDPERYITNLLKFIKEQMRIKK